MLELGIHMDNELFCRTENRTPCSYSSLYLSFFLSSTAKSVSQFSPELCKLESSNMVYTYRMSDCVVGLNSGSWLLFPFISIFLSFPILHVNIKICVGVFPGTLRARMLKLCIQMDNELLYCGIENLTPCSYSSLLRHFFCLSKLNLCHSFLRNCES